MSLLKSIIFYPMMWLRVPFLMLGKFLAGIFLLGGILFLFIGSGVEGATGLIVTCFVLSFVFFLLNIFYDQILLKLNPTGNDLFLKQ